MVMQVRDGCGVNGHVLSCPLGHMRRLLEAEGVLCAQPQEQNPGFSGRNWGPTALQTASRRQRLRTALDKHRVRDRNIDIEAESETETEIDRQTKQNLMCTACRCPAPCA